MSEYKSNSRFVKEHEAKPVERQKVERVVQGTVKVKKKSEAKKFVDLFISEDIGNIKTYVFMDVLVPAVKKAISDIVKNGIEMVLYGEAGRPRNQSSTASKISYRSYYEAQNNRDTTSSASSRKPAYSYDEVVLETYAEAEEVLSRMDELISQYRTVSVADMYDLMGVSGDYTDNKYGWTNLSSACPVRAQGGYILKLPRVQALN